jgi:endonuclease/exonuclease/phosphatase family metal-dependent hydrolase
LRFKLPTDETHPTRHILWAKFTLEKDTLIAMVNHWPSRSGGQVESEANRIAAATRARVFIDSVLVVNNQAKIIFMGDLNDHPRDKAPQLVAEKLNPQITAISGEFGGSYNYKGEWDVLDHMLVSKGLNSKKGFSVIENSGCIHSYDFLLEEYKGSIVPFRTYAGSKYLGGYSDHFPISFEISLP